MNINTKVRLIIKANLMVEEFIFLTMTSFMRDTSKMARKMEGAERLTFMDKFMMANGRMIRNMDLVC